jgi:NADPH:quinone reductase-like Zn-dependent oxidoreductase
MQAVWYEQNGPAREVLQFGEMPDPEPGPGEVRVLVRASGVNPSDWKTRSGSRPMVAPRVIPHSDRAGIIDRVGVGVDPARVGERVWIWNGQWKRAFGTAATYIAVPARTRRKGNSDRECGCEALMRGSSSGDESRYWAASGGFRTCNHVVTPATSEAQKCCRS